MITKILYSCVCPQMLDNEVQNSVSEDMKFLARGPLQHATRFTAYNVNGFKFRTLERERGLKTQNSGVHVVSNTTCYASNSDEAPRFEGVPYYGKLTDIIELNYHGKFKVTVFKCIWADTMRDRGMREDNWHFTSVNFSRVIHGGEHEDHEPFIEASQAQLVFYIDDEHDNGWSVVVHLKPRDLFDMGDDIIELSENVSFTEDQDRYSLLRNDVVELPLARDDDVGDDVENDPTIEDTDSMSE